jgi:hypothetical protein
VAHVRGLPETTAAIDEQFGKNQCTAGTRMTIHAASHNTS